MAKRVSPSKVALFVAGSLVLGAQAAQAAPILTNGGFEAGFTGWTRVDAFGSDGTFALQTGTSSPVNAFTVPAPPEGTTAAMTDAEGPGSHVLYQDFVVPTLIGQATLEFSLFINNLADDFVTPDPNHLSFGTPDLNQQVRVDILQTGPDPFAVSVLQNLFQTSAGDPLVSGYASLSFDITALLQAHVGETLRLRFAEVDNVAPMNAGVDAVNIEVVPVPEPSTLVLFTTGIAAALRKRRRS